MRLVELAQAMAKGEPPRYSIWFGEEQKVLDIYIEKLAETATVVRKESVAGVLAVIDKKTLDRKSKVFVVTEDTDYTKQETRWEEVKKRVQASKHILVLRYNKLNKVNKFYKRNKEDCVEFPKLDETVLVNYILNDLPKLSEDNAIKLCRLCESDYGRITLEQDKIKRLGGTDEAFTALLEQGVIYSSVVGDITFKLTDAILWGDIVSANRYLEMAKRKGEPALRIVSILYQGFRNMLAYQGLGKDKSNAEQRTGLDNRKLWAVKKNLGGYNTKELLRNTLLCQQVEADIKTGKLSDTIALDYLAVKCMS